MENNTHLKSRVADWLGYSKARDSLSWWDLPLWIIEKIPYPYYRRRHKEYQIYWESKTTKLRPPKQHKWKSLND
jgi:hypothetical protein